MIIDKLLSATKRIENVNYRLDIVKELFMIDNPEVVAEDIIKVTDVRLETIYDNDKYSLTIAYYDRVNQGLPLHTHKNEMEYLIVIEGRFILRLGEATRVMSKGECAAVPAGILHTAISLTNTAEMLAICIPPEIAYRRIPNGNH